MRNGDVSFWQYELGPAPRRPSLSGTDHVDVCIVGGGYTGLWTAYYLAKAEPGLRVAVLEARFCGFGASGRNGGWLTAALPGSIARYAKERGRTAALDMRRHMIGGVDEVIRVSAAEGIDADIDKAGELSVAVSAAQAARLEEWHRDEMEWGVADAVLHSAGETDRIVRVAGVHASRWWPHCARLHPAKLVRGLAGAVERAGVTVYEASPVREMDERTVRTDRGQVRADIVVRATEGFTARLPGLRRTWLPMNSCMIVTEPLPDAVWASIGWHRPVALGDQAHAYIYAQRTADGRIALGGRGVPYRFGSRTDLDGRVQPRAVRALTAVLHRYFPATANARIDHAWAGVLAVPRDWCAVVGLDSDRASAWAGGYTGHGVASANLAGRTLRDLVLGRDTGLTALPWVGRTARAWEPEPLRWLGVRVLYAAYRTADRIERRGGGTSVLAKVADRVSGRS
jgi:glycine/D-amino acid oxidase-like deaminating enzyme